MPHTTLPTTTSDPTPTYTAVHPDGITALADIVVPAQTHVSGPEAGDGEWVWTATAPDGTDASAYFDDDTLAEPTLGARSACFTGGAKADGLWALVGVPTVGGVAGPAVTLLVRVGDDEGFVTTWDHEYAADSAYDWSTGSQDLGGVTHSAAAITGGSTLNTVPGAGIVAVSAGGGAPTIFIDIPDLYAGLGLDRHTPIRFWRRLNDNAFTVNTQRNIHGVRADAGAKWLAFFNEHISGVTGGRAARYVGGDQTTPGIGHWTVTCIEIIDTTVRLWYSTAAWGGDWPALADMTVYTANGKEALTAYDQNSTSAVGFSIFTDGQFYVFDAEVGATCRLVRARAQYRA